MTFRSIGAPLLATFLFAGATTLGFAQSGSGAPSSPAAPGTSNAGGSAATTQSGVPSSGTGETADAVRAQNNPAQSTPANSGDDPKAPERTRENERGSTDVNRPN